MPTQTKSAQLQQQILSIADSLKSLASAFRHEARLNGVPEDVIENFLLKHYHGKGATALVQVSNLAVRDTPQNSYKSDLIDSLTAERYLGASDVTDVREVSHGQ